MAALAGDSRALLIRSPAHPPCPDLFTAFGLQYEAPLLRPPLGAPRAAARLGAVAPSSSRPE
jgi:hypothetical protein